MNISSKVLRFTRIAILVALIFLLSMIPIKFVLAHIPVIIGASLFGPAAGAVLGFFFGLSEYIRALNGTVLLPEIAFAEAPVIYTLICFGTRILMGWLTGLLASTLKKNAEKKAQAAGKTASMSLLQYGCTGFVGSLLNTVLYLGSFLVLLTDVIAGQATEGTNVFVYVIILAVFFGIPEALISSLLVPAVCRAMDVIFRRLPAPKS